MSDLDKESESLFCQKGASGDVSTETPTMSDLEISENEGTSRIPQENQNIPTNDSANDSKMSEKKGASGDSTDQHDDSTKELPDVSKFFENEGADKASLEKQNTKEPDSQEYISDPNSKKMSGDTMSDPMSKSDPDKLSKRNILNEIDAMEDNYLSIQFNTLIQKAYWKKDSVCLRIGLDYFRNFEISIVKFQETQLINSMYGEFIMLIGNLKFPLSLINTSKEIKFPYKYFLYFPDGTDDFEQLYIPYNRFFYRKFLQDTCIKNLKHTTHLRFDMMILLPKKKEHSSFWSSPLQNTYNYITSNQTLFHDIRERRLVSLHAFLPSYLGLGYCKPCQNIQEFFSQFKKIFHDLICFFISPLDYNIHKGVLWSSKEDKDQEKFLQEWMMSNFSLENSKSLRDEDLFAKFFLGCSFILHYKLNNHSINMNMALMIDGSIEYFLKNRIFLIKELCISNDFEKQICSSVIHFIFSLILKDKKLNEKLLILIPVYHQLTNIQDEFLQLHDDYEFLTNEYWGFPKESSIYLRDGVTFSSIESALALARYDAILPYSIIIYSLNSKNAKRIIEYFYKNLNNFKFSTFISALLFRYHRVNKKQVEDIKRDDDLRKEVIKCLNDIFISKEDNLLNLQDVQHLNELMIMFTTNLSSQYIDAQLFESCLQLISQGLLFTHSHPNYQSISKISLLFNFIITWYEANIKASTHYYKDFMKEFDFWDKILLDYPFPDSLKWFDFVEKYITDNLFPKMKEQFIIDLFIYFHNERNHSENLQELFRKELIERMKDMTGDRTMLVKELSEKLCDPKQLAKLQIIFSKILLDEEDQFTKNSIEHFINWPSWEIYFKFFSFENDQMLSIDAKKMLESASVHLLTLIEEIISVKITGNNIKIICNKKDTFIYLVQLNKSRSDIDINNLKVKLDQCQKILNWMEDQHTILLKFNDILAKFPGFDHGFLTKFRNHNWFNDSLKSFYRDEKSDALHFPEFPYINNSIQFPQFPHIVSSLSNLQKSQIFIQIFVSFSKNKRDILEDNFIIEKFSENIWAPAIEFSSQILDSLLKQSILISDMIKYFHTTQNLNEINLELRSLYSGFDQNRIIISSKELSPCAVKIQAYFSLHQCSKASEVFIRLKNTLSLESNFEICENLSQANDTFYSKQLKEVTDQVSGVSRVLARFTLNDLYVIQTFIEAYSFVEWVRKTMNNLNDVKIFVDISLTTCAGKPVEINKITCLSSVCTNFAPLIFQLNKDTTFDTLIARCKEVVASVDKNKELIKQLKQAGDCVNFWEEMKKSHGSVEETTLMQLDRITSSGEFSIRIGELLEINEILTLSVKIQHESKVYRLDHLRELRSKLMLVVSKTAVSPNDSYKNAQNFNICLDTLSEIAMIVIQLAETGNQHYFQYKFNFAFNNENKILFNEVSRLKSILNNWKKIVEDARKAHYFLNYYTTSQIVSLQKGINSFIENTENNDMEQLYHLLRLLNHDIIRDDIEQALMLSGFIYQSNSHTRKNNISKQEHYKQSISTVISTKFPQGTTTHPKFVSSLPSMDLEAQFPDTFTPADIDISEKVSEKCEFLLSLTIRGVMDLKKQTSGNVTNELLVEWCVSNEETELESCHLDTTSINIHGQDSSGSPTNTEDSHSGPCTDFSKMGTFLKEIYRSSGSRLRTGREFFDLYNLKLGEPNLVALPSDRIFEFVLSLYMSNNERLPLPHYHEVLVCSSNTSHEEVEIFWRRALMVSDQKDFYLFCLVSIDKLKYEIAVEAVSKFRLHRQDSEKVNHRYKLVLICSEEKEDVSYMAAAFEDYRKIVLTFPKSENVKIFLSRRFSPIHLHATLRSENFASIVDKDRSRVRLVVSESVGAGKSLYVCNLVSDMLSQGVVSEEEREEAAVTVAMHGKQASEEKLTGELLRNRMSRVEHGHLFHVDIASTVQLGLEPILFKLLVLGGICKRSGEMWHCRRNDYYVIEITLNTQVSSLTNFISLYPIVQCVQPFEAIQTNTGSRNTQTLDIEEMKKVEYQRVYAYLMELDSKGDIDKFTYQHTLETRFSHANALNVILKYCGIVKPSWAELRNFVSFLDKQLSDCDQSDYCISGIMERDWKGFKSFVVKFIIHMSRDFATPSLEKENEYSFEDYLTIFKIIERRKWENNSHPYIFFNPDRHTMTFLGFHISNHGHLVNSDNPTEIIENDIMQPQLLKILTANRVNLQENYSSLSKIQKIVKIASVIGTDWLADPDPGYVLTLDNVRKILAILMRFRCNIPVVIMGETGCGKTRLIQFMCALQALQTGAKNMLILKVHGGTTEKEVIEKVIEAEKLAEENSQIIINSKNSLKIDTVLFFDEANTSPAISLIKEIMCDRRMYGKKIRTDIGLQFIAACNPYRKHSTEMLNKLSSAGLGFFTETNKTTDRLGDIPLRELVYRVMELPGSMRSLVWDFGQLPNCIERTYTHEIVAKHLRDCNSPIDANDSVVNVITEVLASAQNFMRGRNDECSFVSLRDVERAMRVLLWFYSKLKYFMPAEAVEKTENKIVHADCTLHQQELGIQYAPFQQSQTISSECSPLIKPSRFKKKFFKEFMNIQRTETRYVNDIDYITYSLILSLSVCYRARLQVREEFDKHITVLFKPPLTPLRDCQTISREVDRCQQVLLDEIQVGKNIAKNTALKENVFMMFVCIELKIPLFVIGKPGSSKSLAKSIISNSMQEGNCSEGSILKNFKQVQLMSYQCSQLSTADGIISVFRSCKNLQRKTGSNKFVACVVLDEVGLAEDSPLLPLKVLHPLLEDSSYSSEDFEDRAELDEQSQRVEMMGKDEDDDEIFTESSDMKNRVAFIGISNWALDPAKMNRGIMVSRGDPDIDELISSAQGICQSESNKGSFIDSIEKEIPQLATAYQNLIGLKANLGKNNNREYYGLRDFYSLIKMLVFLCIERKSKLSFAILIHAVSRNFGGVSDVDPVKIFLKTVKLSEDEDYSINSSPLELIKANLTNLSRSFHGETRYLLLLTENYSALNIILQSPDIWPKKSDIDNIRVIFGSSFPSDQDYSTVCLNINNIKVCMESGKTIILLNLENLYESLYDALNQYYMEFNEQRYVDLGLGTHRMKCRIHNNFKLIVIADQKTVQQKFPTPLINRLEKHFLTMSTVLSKEERLISDLLKKWAEKFSALDRTHFDGLQKICEYCEGDCFIGYHADTPFSIVFNIMKTMYHDKRKDQDQDAVLEDCKIQLLKMASMDAVLRVKNSFLSNQSQKIMEDYFELQLGSLEEYLRHAITNINIEKKDLRNHLTLATTHSRLLTDKDVNLLKELLNLEADEIKCLSLQQFQSEQQFSSEIQKFLKGEVGFNIAVPGKRILLVQCDKGTVNAKLIACARHKIVDELSDWREEKDNRGGICLVFLVQLKREAHGSGFESFCGGDWNTVHIDDIRCLDYKELPPISELIGKQIYQMFENEENFQSIKVSRTFQWIKFKDCIQSAVSRLDDFNEQRTLSRIREFSEYINEKERYDLIYQSTCKRVTTLLQEQYKQLSDIEDDWLQRTANCGEDIQSSGTFRKAVNLCINKTITPLLAELIALLDRNGNLELGLLRDNLPLCLHELWQTIFQDEQLLILTYKDIINLSTLKPRPRVPVLNDGAGGKFFNATFPFSWLIKKITSDLLKESKNMIGISSRNLWIGFESFFDNTTLGNYISQIFFSKEVNVKYIRLYLRDFIYMSIYPQDEESCDVFEFVILECIKNYAQASGLNKNEFLAETTPTIPRIHCAYGDSKQLIELIEEAFHLDERLIHIFHKTIFKLKDKNDQRLNSMEHVLLEEIISLCSHENGPTNFKDAPEKYILQIRLFQPIVEKSLTFQRQDEFYKQNQLKFRYLWDRIIAVHSFISHCTTEVGLNITETIINRLFMLLGESPDFTSARVIKHILNIISNCLNKIGKGAGQLKENFKKCATRSFLSILTNLTFKYLEVSKQNSDLVTLLMGFVTLDEKGISEILVEGDSINLFTKDGLDPSSAFRTFLLQLLIKHRLDVFKEKISIYLGMVSKYRITETLRDLFLLIIHSIEDSLHEKFKKCDDDNQYSFFHEQMSYLPDQPPTCIPISYELFECIAILRFLCIHVSQGIIERYGFIEIQAPDFLEPIKIENQRLILDFKNLCLTQGYEDLHVFLLKNIYHQLGSDTIHLIESNRECLWILPECVQENMKEFQPILPDYFIIYGEEYIRITSALEQVCSLQKKDALLQFFPDENDPSLDSIQCLLYSIFQETVKAVKKYPQETQDVYQKFLTLKDFLNDDLKNLGLDVQNLAMQISCNNLGNNITPRLILSSTTEHHDVFLIRLIYHVAVMLSTKKYYKLFLPIALIYENPIILKGKLFPTMMDDQFLSVKAAMLVESGAWYCCPNGHPYFIGNCGGAATTYLCPECGRNVGGKDYILMDQNELFNSTKDETKTGYLLGLPSERRNISSGERSLAPASLKVLRALMHATFTWSSCSNHPVMRSDALPSLMDLKLDNPSDLPNFFYQHLERDITDFAGLIGKNFEEAIFVLHLIVKSLMQSSAEQCIIPNQLTERELRDQWEREFDQRFIQPILNSLNSSGRDEMDQVLREKRIINNPLLRIVYERDEPEPEDLVPHLWRYRTIVSLDHFSRSFSTADSNIKKKCPIIDRFLKEKRTLYVTRYLPDLVQLQLRVKEKFLHRLDRCEAITTTIGDFLNRLKKEHSEEAVEFGRLVKSLDTAWSIIGEEVKVKGRLRNEEVLEQRITPGSPLAYLLPSTRGEGLLITVLTDYLLLVHNSFVHAYREIVKGPHTDKIPLRDVTSRHMIECEEHIQLLLLSHAHYSLALGQGTKLRYDFEGVEKEIIEQLIQSKPLITAQHLCFEYSREAYNLTLFKQVRHKVQQAELEESVWEKINKEKYSLEAVNDALLVLDVVIGILASAGGDPEQKLFRYLHDVLKYPQTSQGAGSLLESRRVECWVDLKHVISFWRFLSLEKARQVSILGQVPYSSLREEFLEELSEEEKKQIRHSCDHFKVEKVLLYLHDFILFFVRERDSEEKNSSLKDFVVEYANQNGWNLPRGFLDRFPKEIKLSQCVTTWAVLARRNDEIKNPEDH